MPRPALHRDPTQLGELCDRRGTAEPTPARVLDAAERHLRLIADGLVVDVDDARVDLGGQRKPALGIARDDAGGEAVARRVRPGNCLVRAIDDLDGRDRAEGLEQRQVGVGRDVGHERRLEDGSLCLSACEHARAGGDRIVDT